MEKLKDRFILQLLEGLEEPPEKRALGGEDFEVIALAHLVERWVERRRLERLPSEPE